MARIFMLLAAMLLLAACNLDLNTSVSEPNNGSVVSSVPAGDSARVVRVIDGDTIDVNLGGTEYRVRYVGMNTPERDEVCYREAVDANRRLVEGQTVTLVRDTSNTDRYDRLLRYIYVGNTFVNQALVEQGYAEAVRYDPDDQEWQNFVALERQAASANLGCHPTGIFNDNSDTR